MIKLWTYRAMMLIGTALWLAVVVAVCYAGIDAKGGNWSGDLAIIVGGIAATIFPTVFSWIYYLEGEDKEIRQRLGR